MPVFETFENFANTQNAKAPPGMKNLIQASSGWNYMPSERMLVQNAIQGIAIAVAFAFLILLIATRNII